MSKPFTDNAGNALKMASQNAHALNNDHVGTEHILLGLAREGCGTAAIALQNLDLALSEIRGSVEKLVESDDEMVATNVLPQTPAANKAIQYAIEEAQILDHDHVGTAHLLLGLLRQQEGVAARVLMDRGLTHDEFRNEVLRLWRYVAVNGRQKPDEESNPS